MSDLNTRHNRAVWFDIPVADLVRAGAFYAGVLDIAIHPVRDGEHEFAVLDHDEGNGGCLVLEPADISSTLGVLVYMNVDGRIRDAVTRTDELGGKVLTDVHPIGPHGWRAIVLDSEGNRIALHSTRDA